MSEIPLIGEEALWRLANRVETWQLLRDEMASAYVAGGHGDATSSPRQIIRSSGGDALGVMACVLERQETIMATKIVALPKNPVIGRSHPGVVVLINPGSGHPLLCLDADAVTALRTAAATAAVTQAARPRAARLSVLGTGTQAVAHLLSFSATFPDAELLVWGRDSHAARRVAEQVADRATVKAVGSLADAIAEAHVVTSVTAAREAFLDASMVAPGTLINAIGASISGLAEWKSSTFDAADFIFCDDVEECRQQSEEVPNHCLERAIPVYQILDGSVNATFSESGRLTIYKSVGSAVLDAAAASVLCKLVSTAM